MSIGLVGFIGDRSWGLFFFYRCSGFDFFSIVFVHVVLPKNKPKRTQQGNHQDDDDNNVRAAGLLDPVDLALEGLGAQSVLENDEEEA